MSSSHNVPIPSTTKIILHLRLRPAPIVPVHMHDAHPRRVREQLLDLVPVLEVVREHALTLDVVPVGVERGEGGEGGGEGIGREGVGVFEVLRRKVSR